MMAWLRSLFPPPASPRVEVRLMTWAEADKRIRAGEPWRVAPEEDSNRQRGLVWVERFEPQ
jgi:hypothetical protein